MPVYRFSLFSCTLSVLIWKIEESVQELYLQLPPEFLADFQSANLSSKARITQSLAVRIALYYLLKKLNLPLVTLTKNEQGRPILEHGSLYVGFTHTRYLAAVALSTTCPIGIDIEMVKSTLHRVQKKYLNLEEMKSANDCLAKLAIYWSAKEALYKGLDKQPIAAFKDIFIEPFPLAPKGTIIAYFHQKRYTMDYQQIVDSALPQHVLVYAANEVSTNSHPFNNLNSGLDYIF